MKKLFSLFAALTLSAGLWAEAPANVESVDLGLPSGLKWATFNVGATAPEGNGDYFAWGETEPYYSSQDPITWKTGKENGYAWESYCGSSSFDEWSTAPYDASTKILKPEFDAATANWGSDWRMPTKAEQDELRTECTWTWTEDYNGTGIKGYIVTSKAEGNTNSIFLPASGFRNNSSLNDVGSYGFYWSSSLYESYSSYAYYLEFASNSVSRSSNSRYYGRSVRPVTTKLIVPGPKVGEQFVDTISVLKFEVTAVGETNTVKVIANSYTGTSYNIPATVSYNDVTFAVTEIGEMAFQSCTALQSVTIPASVTTIGGSAFNGCSALQSITIPASVTEIGSGAFAASGLQTITIPAGVTEIQTGAFYECTGLTSVTFLGNACQDAIGGHAFDGVGDPDPALLTLHGTWAKENQPDEDGSWYGGTFELSEDPTPVLQYDADAPFDATFAYADMESSISNGVISISATNAEGLTIGLELYANPTATTIPEGVYTISDSQEAGTALKSVGMTGSVLNECFAGIRAASGAFADTWFMVEGTVTLSYDEYGKLKVVVDGKNSYGQPVTALVQYVKLEPKKTVDFTDAELYVYDGFVENYGLMNFYGGNADGYEFDLYAHADTIAGDFLEAIDFGYCKLTSPAGSIGIIDAYEFKVVADGKNLTLTAKVLGSDTIQYNISATGYLGYIQGDAVEGYVGEFAVEEVAIQQVAISEVNYIHIAGTNAAGDQLALVVKGELADGAIAAGTYTEVMACPGFDAQGQLNPSYVGNNAGVWFIQSGKLTINADGSMKFEGLNSYDKDVTINFIVSTPSALPTLFGDGVKGNKFMHNGQMIIRKDGKNYNAAGAEL